MLKGQLALFGGEEDYKEPGAAFCRRQERRDSNFLWLVSIFTTERWSITIYYPWEAWNGTFIIWDKTDLCYGLFLPKNQFVQWLKNIENGTGCAGCWVSAQKCYQCYQFPDSQWFLWKSIMTGYSCLNPFQSLSVTLATQSWQQQVRQWCFWHGILRNELVIFASGWPRAAQCWRIIYNPRVRVQSVSGARSRLAPSQCLSRYQ